MIGLDTNVIIRYLVQDDPKQSSQANRIIQNAIAEGMTIWISQITLCEVVWVLESSYKISKNELIEVIRQLLFTQGLTVENETVALHALHDFENHTSVDFSDCLIGRHNVANKCVFTFTFDRKAAKRLPSIFKSVS